MPSPAKAEHKIGEGPYTQQPGYFLNQTELAETGKALMYTLLDNIEKSFAGQVHRV